MYYSKLTVTVQILRHNDQEEDEELDALSKAVLYLFSFCAIVKSCWTLPFSAGTSTTGHFLVAQCVN
jgi:hypothetical protein